MDSAQLGESDIDEGKCKQTLLCLWEGKAFVFMPQYMASSNNAKNINEAMMEEFCREDHKQTLETKRGTINFTRKSNTPLFSLELKKLTNIKTVQY